MVTTRETIEREVYALRDEYGPAPADREHVAMQVALVVARFVGDDTTARRRILMGEGPEDTAAYIEQLEDYVRANAEAAESVDLEPGVYWVGLIGPILGDLGLFDDYLRIKRHEQHMAFASEED